MFLIKYLSISLILVFFAYIMSYILGNFYGYAEVDMAKEAPVLYIMFWLLLLPLLLSPFAFLLYVIRKTKETVLKPQKKTPTGV